MKYWFIFVKDAVMLEKNADGSRTIPLLIILPSN